MSPAQAWSTQDSMWQGAYLTAHVADWGQTRDISVHCNSGGSYSETNLLLGRCPSLAEVNSYFLGTAILHTGAAYLIPHKYRRAFQLSTLGMQLNFVNNNKQIGLKFNF
ncbi:MAG: hypothetical protein OEW58_07260 [Gammaproteobacteria bacterium]|nr:hypothetical protein [Gammaproteobacteria bacterium]